MTETEQLTDQQALTIVAKHLLAQNEKSSNPRPNPEDIARCYYRGPRDLKCAIGALIPDDEYRVGLEKCGLQQVIDAVPSLTGLSYSLLAGLQTVHDRYEPEGWEKQLQHVASNHSLKVEWKDEVTP